MTSKTKEKTVMSQKDNEAYDSTPYPSFAYSQSRPEYLRTLGILFGMEPPAVETARVLELGCAEGGNLIPHATRYPKATFVGVDLSKVQINAGLEHIKKLGLKNITLKHMSIADIDENFGEFDYIICHGVISWVPDFVRDKILEVSSKNLSKNGIAYISYNTLPGWNMVRTIRDMMLYHTNGYDNPAEKVSQSRLLLQFVNDALEKADTPYSKFLRSEAELLSKQQDGYLSHDHLEDENKQFYFEEFMKEAASKGLQYLSDTSLSSMYVGNMPEKAAEKLSAINDIVRTEQYMDFITNRRFRSTLLCKNNVPLNRNITSDLIKKFSLAMNVNPEVPLESTDVNSRAKLKFYLSENSDAHVATDIPALKAILYCFVKNHNNPLKYDEFVKQANALLKQDATDLIEAQLLSNAMSLVMKGFLQLNLEPGVKNFITLDKPKLSQIALHQISNTQNNWVTSNHHVTIAISSFDKISGKYMDGKNTKDQIIDKLIKDVSDKVMQVTVDNKIVSDPKMIKESLTAQLDDTINRFAKLDVFSA